MEQLYNTNSSQFIYLQSRSKLKYRLYYFFQFYRQNIFSTLYILLFSGYCLYQKEISLGLTVYLLLSPLILGLTQSFLFRLTVLFLAYWLPNPIILFTLFMTVTQIHTYQIKTETSTFRKLNYLKVILPLFALSLLIQHRFSALVQKQFLILLSFVLITHLQASLTKSKEILTGSKNRYILWSLKTKRFNFRFLNNILQQQLLLYSILGVYFLILMNIKQRSLGVSFMLVCVFFYLLLFELDVLIHYHFFNQSQLYDDTLSRVVFSQVSQGSMGMLLLYFAILEVLQIREIYLKGINLFFYIFIVWFLFWIIFFIKRYKKPIIRHLILICILPGMLACQKSEVESLLIKDTRPLYSGTMTPENIQEIFNLDDSNYSVKVSHGQSVKKDETLIYINNPLAIEEINRINFQIEQHESKINILEKELSKLQDEMKSPIQTEISSLKESLDLLNFDKKQVKTGKNVRAQFDGTVFIHNNSLKLVSDSLILTLTLSEHEYKTFKAITSFEILNLDREPISIAKAYLVEPKEENLLLSFSSFDHECHPNQTLLVREENLSFDIPKHFIRENEDTLLVKTDATEMLVEGIYDGDTYLITEGLKEGDIIYAYSRD